MQNRPSAQSWSPPFPKWHGFPRWDYAPSNARSYKLPRLNPSTPIPAIRYWCSWYAYGWNIDHKKISETLKIIKKHRLPFTHIIIDDGWTTWGDWLTPNPARFPHFATTISQIRAHHLQVGLWFAPFLASKKSQLFKQHPDWFVRYRGQYIQGLKTMPIWEWFLPQQYLLDFKLPQVKKYIKDFIDYAIKNWGITLLKLDFLYAPYFDPHHNNDKIAHNQIWLFRTSKTILLSRQSPAVHHSRHRPRQHYSHQQDTALPLNYLLSQRIIYAVR
jgi:alpha-glucosidase (family GH31 glycosyl hydrolase)